MGEGISVCLHTQRRQTSELAGAEGAFPARKENGEGTW